MYSKAKISGHPIHPALVAFPVAFYVATLVALIAFEGTRDAFWFRLASWGSLAGIVMAAIAAVPGLIDLLSIPAGTRARSTAITHALLNVVALLLFLITTILLWRQWQSYPALALSAGAPLVLSIVGVCLLIAAGALGWTLVQTHHIGVTDPIPADSLAPRTTTLPGTGTTVPHTR